MAALAEAFLRRMAGRWVPSTGRASPASPRPQEPPQPAPNHGVELSGMTETGQERIAGL
jgi:hypothetical protein